MTSIGMSRITGAALADDDHIAQSCADILSTPLGTRPMRRDYGSMVFDLLDAPFHRATALLVIAATALALARWEPRIRLTRVQWSGDLTDGAPTLTITGAKTGESPATALTTLTIPLSRPAAA